jgi:hypothetical protein
LLARFLPFLALHSFSEIRYWPMKVR